MNEALYQFISLDLPPLLTAGFAAAACAMLGNFLVLRKLSLMGDAISHAVLPGIVAAFLIAGTRATLPVLIGAACAGVLTTVLVELTQRLGRVEAGASIGVVFSILFALGILLMEQAAARNVDLDADCLLHGQLETIFWFPARAFPYFFSFETLFLLPRQVVVSALIAFCSLAFIVLLFKELKIAAFDSALADALGFSATKLHYLLMIFVAAAVVVSFEAVGSILVIAMIICPAAVARLLTDSLKIQILLSVMTAQLAVTVGYILAGLGPQMLGLQFALSAAGMITVVLGAFVLTSVLFAPQYGVIARKVRYSRHTKNVVFEDLLGFLYRAKELGTSGLSAQKLCDSLERLSVASGQRVRKSKRLVKQALELALAKKLLRRDSSDLCLTPAGEQSARQLVRTHRLWETYLVELMGLRPDHVHDRAMELEHFTSAEMRERLAKRVKHAGYDPHGKKIPDNTEQ